MDTDRKRSRGPEEGGANRETEMKIAPPDQNILVMVKA